MGSDAGSPPYAAPAPPGGAWERALVLGRLLRISLLPSALADVLAGLALGGAGTWPGVRALLLVPASLGVYHGALALNDWVDREHDGRTRPDRPLPSGGVRPATALALALLLMLAGCLCGLAVHPLAGAWTLGLALAAAGYDLFGRGPWRGPLLLGLCRAGNLGLGLLAPTWLGSPGAPAGPLLELWLPALAYGTYVFLLSRLGRLEDGEGGALGRRPSRLLRAAALALLGVGVAAALAGRAVLSGDPDGGWVWVALVPTALGALGLWRGSDPREAWSPATVGAAVGRCLRRLLLCSAACAASVLPAGSFPWWVLAVALGGYPLAHALRRVFPPS